MGNTIPDPPKSAVVEMARVNVTFHQSRNPCPSPAWVRLLPVSYQLFLTNPDDVEPVDPVAPGGYGQYYVRDLMSGRFTALPEGECIARSSQVSSDRASALSSSLPLALLARQAPGAVEDRHRAVLILVDLHLGPHVVAPVRPRRDL